MALSVAVVILNWNGEKLLQKFLPSVLQTTYSSLQIIVADNASTDNSITLLKKEFPQVAIIALPENYGFAKGYNEALQRVNADVFVLLNSDVEVTPNWLETIVTMFEQEDNLGVCQPMLLNQIHRNQFDYAGAAGGYMDKLGFPLARGRVLENIEENSNQYNSNATIFWASGAAFFIRKKLFQQLNGFDANFFAHQEEIDLCWRVQLLGYKVKVCAASVVYHVGGATLTMGSPQKTYLNFRNNLIMLRKNLPKEDVRKQVIARFFIYSLAALKFLLTGNWRHTKAAYQGFLHALKWKQSVTENTIKKPLVNLDGVVAKNILIQYYVRGKKTFTELVK